MGLGISSHAEVFWPEKRPSLQCEYSVIGHGSNESITQYKMHEDKLTELTWYQSLWWSYVCW